MCLGHAVAQDQCSLHVYVVDPHDRAVSGVDVKVQEANGRVASNVAEKGEANFCDLGVSSVDVSVGPLNGCTHTVVRNVQIDWGVTREVKVIFDPSPCQVDGPPPIFPCRVLFRFYDERGLWIPGVRFNPPLRRGSLQSDNYGRIMVAMQIGEELHAATEKSGYLPEAIDLKCSFNMMERERIVTLRRPR